MPSWRSGPSAARSTQPIAVSAGRSRATRPSTISFDARSVNWLSAEQKQGLREQLNKEEQRKSITSFGGILSDARVWLLWRDAEEGSSVE